MGMRFNRLGTLLDLSKLSQLSLASPATLKSSDDSSIIAFAAKKFKVAAEQLEITKELETDKEGFKHVTLRQVLGGVPVYGCDLKLHIEKMARLSTQPQVMLRGPRISHFRICHSKSAKSPVSHLKLTWR